MPKVGMSAKQLTPRVSLEGTGLWAGLWAGGVRRPPLARGAREPVTSCRAGLATPAPGAPPGSSQPTPRRAAAARPPDVPTALRPAGSAC